MALAHSIPVALLTATILALPVALGLGNALAQAPQEETVEQHLAAAKTAAAFDFTGALARICINPQTAPGGDRPPAAWPPRAAWAAEPAKVFDNLYFVGTK